MSSKLAQIYIALLGENVDVWRPAKAEHLHGNVYRISAQDYDKGVESWQFSPGDEVVCEMIEADGDRILAAIRKA
jgi:hypothetical protein